MHDRRRTLKALAAAGPDARKKGLAALHEPPFAAAVDAQHQIAGMHD